MVIDMGKKQKIALWILAPFLAVLIAAFCVSYFVLQLPLFDRTGWSEKDGAVRYLDYYGRAMTQWQTIDENRYYFGEDGNLRTGWQMIEGNRYYFCPEGQMHTGFLDLDGQCYYLTDEGTPHIGWLELDGKQTYFSEPEGVRHNGWLQMPEGTYYLEDGCPKTGWVESEGIRYYLKPDGTLDAAWQDDGTLLHYTVDGQPYSGWYRGEEGIYWFDEKGTQKIGWITDETGRFYLYPDGTHATGFVEINGIERYFLPSGEYVLLCNRWNPVPEDYEMNLVQIGSKQMDATCAASLQQMIDDAKKAGISTRLNSAYRSEEKQQKLWKQNRARYIRQGMSAKKADIKVGQTTAIPGTSEHQTGLSVDIGGSTKTYRWLEENCWRYGFILRYQKGKTDITGIIYEPWHFRYVGEEMAKAVMESGLCLEEYLEKLKTEA